LTKTKLTILLATKNAGKTEEVLEILKGLPVEIKTLNDVPDAPDVVEDQPTFEGNALKKARTLAERYRSITLADDSGLEVDALDGRPGVYSARFAGEDATDDANNRKLLSELENVPDNRRQARFRCVMALVRPGGGEHTFDGTCEGRITRQTRGSSGFGYDPLFIPDGYTETFAEIGAEEKNRISHRAKALEKLKGAPADLLIEEGIPADRTARR
jgi:XTP/dITP diphosphohydrolase